MIRVTVEFIPKGDEANKREIATMEIVNTVDSDDPTTGNYNIKYVVIHPNGDVQASTRRLEGYQRLRWNALGIVLAALEALGLRGLEGGNDERALEA